mgnify:CR=1 FL=1
MHAPVAITPTCTNATPAIARVCANPHEGITRFCRVPRRAEKTVAAAYRRKGKVRLWGTRMHASLAETFLKGTGVAALAMAGGALVGCSSGNDASASGVSSESTAVDGSSIAWTKEADVVVCGYGAAGASCAIEAAANGASVIIAREGSAARWFYGSLRRCHHGCADEDPESSRHRRQCRRVIRLDNDLHRRHMQQGYRTRLC